ncbi:MAG TPA: hypothetical protein VGS07_26205 [Thermoanaerobaculia bacterium]|jgi:hypothetical protein|nr:hypothetical protein [Thermoanaerobaculia bacterium]
MLDDLLDFVAIRRRAVALPVTFLILTVALACLGVGPAAGQTTAQGVDEELLSLTGSQPALAADIRGGFVAIWTDTEAENEGLGIRGCLLAPKNGGCGPHFAVNTTALGDQIRPAVAADDPGRFVVAWQGAVESGTGVFGQRFGAGGIKLGPEILLSSADPGSQQSPRVAMEEGGSFVAVWLDHHDSQPSFALARFSAKGKPLDAELPMKAEHGIDDGTLVASSRGGFTVGRNEASACSGGNDSSASISRFDAKGGPVGKVYELASSQCGDDGFTLASLVGSRAGTLAVFTGPGGFSAQRFAPSGEPAGGRFALTSQPACVENRCERAAAVAMDDRGRFAVIWEVSENGTVSNLFAQLFTLAGKPRTERLPVNATPSMGLESPAAALANDGDLLVAWTRSDTQHSERMGLFLRRLRLE